MCAEFSPAIANYVTERRESRSSFIDLKAHSTLRLEVTPESCNHSHTEGPAIMAAAVLKPPKRVLHDSTKVHQNRNPVLPSPNSAKRRKLDHGLSPSKPKSSQENPRGKIASSQPKSQFEEGLEKLTQDINDLKDNNSEKDQQWKRPSIADFDPLQKKLVFQQIEAEEGTLHGGQTTIKLFGVTEVCSI